MEKNNINKHGSTFQEDINHNYTIKVEVQENTAVSNNVLREISELFSGGL